MFMALLGLSLGHFFCWVEFDMVEGMGGLRYKNWAEAIKNVMRLLLSISKRLEGV